ncbi:hypothetical protein D9757_004540 [Collybiopsis confluens]|uniref:tRNA-splicing endonuclease subunit Sen2 n=1 Tax=Collybiopsis confluens TaxID=2823264 RepID=A0A8H5ME69_9AGAR|nr:hypothetical protein D9757_004540 [Collybiopsis confluens]
MNNNRNRGGFKGGARRHENNRIYAYPLPLIFESSSSSPNSTNTRPHSRSILGLLGLLGLSTPTQVLLANPHCEGYLDLSTRSVWVVTQRDAEILWRRGFFGKGNLSRSEPSWFVRKVKDIQARKQQQQNQNSDPNPNPNLNQSGTQTHSLKPLTSEEVREKRRAERRQFKLDRAEAIARVAAEAEALFETEGKVVVPALFGPEIPSGATWRPKPVEEIPQPGASSSSFTQVHMEEKEAEEEEEEEEEEPIEDMEHLQLTLQESFFLAWNFDCLTILDSETDEPLTLSQIWTTFQHLYLVPPIPELLTPNLELEFDNPFLIHYAVYHHYRSLGWVVKSGLKFCVDYLLYKRGPVFTHAEFSIVVCPVYEDPEDQQVSTTRLQNASPFTWSWLSTINRANSQVMKQVQTLPQPSWPLRSYLSPAIDWHPSHAGV